MDAQWLPEASEDGARGRGEDPPLRAGERDVAGRLVSRAGGHFGNTWLGGSVEEAARLQTPELKWMIPQSGSRRSVLAGRRGIRS